MHAERIWRARLLSALMIELLEPSEDFLAGLRGGMMFETEYWKTQLFEWSYYDS
jgi:hypothetical protein